MIFEKTKYLLTLLFICIASACGGGGDGGDGTEPLSPTLSAALPNENGIGFLQTQFDVAENQRVLEVLVFRAGDAQGDASVAYSVTGITASDGTDFLSTSGTLNWISGETGIKTFSLTVNSDIEAEAIETATLALTQTAGTGLLANSAEANVSILDSACDAVISGQSAGSVHLIAPCYHLIGNLMLGSGDQFTAVAGTTLVVAEGSGIVIGEGASIALAGSTAKPITFRGAEARPGAWTGLELRDSDSDVNGLQHTIIRDATIGLSANSYSALTLFSNNQLVGNGLAARLPTPMASRLDRTSSFVGNERDFVTLVTSNLNDAHFLPSVDVPYLTDGTIVVNGELAIEAGTELYFSQGDFLIVSTSGTLRALGTAIEPIVLTGAEPVPGYWNGLHFSTMVNSASQLDYVHVSYGGGDPIQPGNIAIYGGAPTIPITNSIISNSLGHAIWVSADHSSINTDGTEFVGNAGEDVYYFN